MMTRFNQTTSYDGVIPEEARGTRPLAPLAIIFCGLAGLLIAVLGYMSGLALFWSAVLYLVTGQILFGLACLRYCFVGDVSSATVRREIEDDLAACNECEREPSLL